MKTLSHLSMNTVQLLEASGPISSLKLHYFLWRGLAWFRELYSRLPFRAVGVANSILECEELQLYFQGLKNSCSKIQHPSPAFTFLCFPNLYGNMQKCIFKAGTYLYQRRERFTGVHSLCEIWVGKAGSAGEAASRWTCLMGSEVGAGARAGRLLGRG